jgi:hypothetical protein
MNWKGYAGKRWRHNLRLYYRVCLERLRETTKSIGHVTRSREIDLNPGHPENETRALTNRPQRSTERHDVRWIHYTGRTFSTEMISDTPLSLSLVDCGPPSQTWVQILIVRCHLVRQTPAKFTLAAYPSP